MYVFQVVWFVAYTVCQLEILPTYTTQVHLPFRVTTLPGKSWNLVRPFSRPGKSWKTAKVMESHGK